ncbi:MAG: hypothetical protein U9N35_00785 [Euryarchaeota archaeon]|nr:hypothetical protein [Euryarchaeota archaeon]
MERKIGIGIGVLVLVLIGAIVASAVAAWDRESPHHDEIRDADNDGTPNGLDKDYERPTDDRGSLRVNRDERVERFWERFDLTNEQITAIQEEVVNMIDEGAGHEKIRETVETMLKSFGVEGPELMGSHRKGQGYRGQGAGFGNCPYEEK